MYEYLHFKIDVLSMAEMVTKKLINFEQERMSYDDLGFNETVNI